MLRSESGFVGEYSYSFNGMEKDDEVKGNGNHLDFGARCYDSRLGRWLSLDAYATEYPSLSDYVFVANSSIIFIDPDGNVIDLGNLTAEQLTEYNSTIKLLKTSDIFTYYYSVLEQSKVVYSVGKGGAIMDGKESGGTFNPNTGYVGMKSLNDSYTVAQELFHAYQTDQGFYENKDHSVAETEGDLLSKYVIMDVGLPVGSTVGYVWDSEILNEFDPDGYGYGIPSAKDIDSEKYQTLFTESVDKRITMYTKLAQEQKTTAYKGYTLPNSGKGSLGLSKVKRESESKDLVGPRLENGDYYGD